MLRLALLATAVLFAVVTLQGTADARAIKYSISKSRYFETPERNNYLSARYDYLLQTNYHFRRYRMRKECHPINWIPLHNSCIASFDQYEPFIGRR
jgi:hypothetical protein